MTKEGSTRNVNFWPPWAGVDARSWTNKSLIVNMYYLLPYQYIYSTLIANVLRNYDAAFLYHCWFLFIL